MRETTSSKSSPKVKSESSKRHSNVMGEIKGDKLFRHYLNSKTHMARFVDNDGVITCSTCKNRII